MLIKISFNSDRRHRDASYLYIALFVKTMKTIVKISKRQNIFRTVTFHKSLEAGVKKIRD